MSFCKQKKGHIAPVAVRFWRNAPFCPGSATALGHVLRYPVTALLSRCGIRLEIAAGASQRKTRRYEARRRAHVPEGRWRSGRARNRSLGSTPSLRRARDRVNVAFTAMKKKAQSLREAFAEAFWHTPNPWHGLRPCEMHPLPPREEQEKIPSFEKTLALEYGEGSINDATPNRGI
jgi:hypothetical protein